MDVPSVSVGLLAFVPALSAIVVVFILRDVVASLFSGVVVGIVIFSIFSSASLLEILKLFFYTIFDSIIRNIPLIAFMLMLGSIVSLITKSGGHFAYGRLVAKKIKNARAVSLATMALGVLIFIDDYFSCLLTGAVMGPIADKQKMSREKLAYFIDSTAAPICILAPVSSWTMTITKVVEESGIDNGLLTFIKSVPYNYYAIFALFFALFIAITKKDFSYMKKYENKMVITTKETLRLYGTAREINNNQFAHDETKGNIVDLLLPNIAVIVLSLLSIAWLGGFFSGEGITLVEAYTAADTTLAINFACISALLLCFLLYIPRRVLTIREFCECTIEGMKSMFAAVLILIMAWTLSSITTDHLGAAAYVEQIMQTAGSNVNLSLLPLLIFILSALAALGLGSWGTFLVTIPFIAIIARTTDPSSFYILLASTLGGAVFGDHASPITDTTILASIGAKCNHIGHVKTQLPYALLCCFGTAVAFMFTGFTHNYLLSLAAGVLAIILSLTVIYKKDY